MKRFIIAGALGVLFGLILGLFVTADAATVIKTTRGPKTDQVEVVGAADNGNGTTKFVLVACGTLIEATVDNVDVKNQNPAVMDAINAAVEKACK